jgi:hypothetical protein
VIDCTSAEAQLGLLVACRNFVEEDQEELSSVVELDIHQLGHMD